MCRARPCSNEIVSNQLNVCSQHLHLANQCRVDGCERDRRDKCTETCDSPEHLQHHENYKKNIYEKAKRKKLLKQTAADRMTTNHGRAVELQESAAAAAGKLVSHCGPAYTPMCMVSTWTCGVILSVERMYSHEAFRDVGPVLENLLQLMNAAEVLPELCFYDRACSLHPYIQSKNVTCVYRP